MDCKTNEIFAGKIVPKKLLSKDNQKEKMVQEIQIHQSLNHKHVVKFHRFFEDSNFVYILLELCRKRSMMEMHKRRKALTEPEVRYFIKQILEGVLYLHDLRIIHRDLKLGNLFLNDNLEVKIGDFGLAAKIEYIGQRKKTLCGTPNYIAPEILTKKGHSFEVDVWSIGCIMYTLLVGKPPFETNSLKETYAKIKRCEYHLPNNLPKATAYMLHQMLLPDPSKRPSVKQLLGMDFMRNGFLPKELPASCLTMAPHFDSIMNLPNRKPLIEVNQGGEIIPSGDAKKPKKSVYASCSGQRPSTATAKQCRAYLSQLQKQISQVIVSKPARLTGVDLDELSDPAAQPFIWIAKWVDYSDKYGFGYQLCDDGFGVMFNDSSKIVLLPNHRNVHYIEKDGTENYYLMDSTPPNLDKKIKLLAYFRRYMNENLMKAGGSVPVLESDNFSRIPHLHLWHRSSTAVIMQLTNGTVQINFMDHTKIIMCPLMQAVTYIDENKNFRTFRFSTLISMGCPKGLFDNLAYADRKITNLLSDPL